jgi:hypothetical protein
MARTWATAVVVIGCGLAFPSRAILTSAQDPPTLAIVDVQQMPQATVRQFGLLDVQFQVIGLQASHLQWPFDAEPPKGVPPGEGISVDAVFTDPDGRSFRQPAFHAQEFVDGVEDGRDWHMPTGRSAWHVRFTPNRAGPWHYTITARDRGGVVSSPGRTFMVAPSSARGFIRVAEADRRYFEFEDGSLFTGLGVEVPEFLDEPASRGGAEYQRLAGYGMNFGRLTIASLFGSAWLPWIGGRNQYRGHLPVTGLVPYRDEQTGGTTLAMRLDYEPAGDSGWFDACRMQAGGNPESVKPRTLYRLRIQYRATGIVGPRDPRYPKFGIVAKIGGWHPDCYEPETGTPITFYGRDTSEWTELMGEWWSGDARFLPRLYLALENVRSGAAYVRSVSLREVLDAVEEGPEMMVRPSMAVHTYVPEEQAHAFDRVLANAERTGVFLKVVLGEVNDKLFLKLQDDGSWVSGEDNVDGFYGLGRRLNATRWLQQAYVQARWGYSTSIHSWELLNEGDPVSVAHYEVADEFGKFMHCRVFGVEPGGGGGVRCPLDHPNDHLVTTSFWRWFPAKEFWANPAYPNVDYADLHAYVATSPAPRDERQTMTWDTAHYHLWHSAEVARAAVGKPVVRGEAGLDLPEDHREGALPLDTDARGIWLHNFLWSTLDAGGLYELYWWRSHIWNEKYDHRGAYAALANFLRDIPLNKGGYQDWGGTVTPELLRVVGQKDVSAGRMHLWIQNRGHQWRAAINRVPPDPVSGIIEVSGFQPGTAYVLDWWDTYAAAGRLIVQERLTADTSGSLRIVVAPLAMDVALKIRPEDRQLFGDAGAGQ